MRTRHQAIPRLESMEDRLVLSTTTLSPYASAAAELRRFGSHLHKSWTGLEHFISGLYQQSQANSTAASRWATHPHHVHRSTADLFGIPGFRL
jgi:hypothetical protein